MIPTRNIILIKIPIRTAGHSIAHSDDHGLCNQVIACLVDWPLHATQELPGQGQLLFSCLMTTSRIELLLGKLRFASMKVSNNGTSPRRRYGQHVSGSKDNRLNTDSIKLITELKVIPGEQTLLPDEQRMGRT